MTKIGIILVAMLCFASCCCRSNTECCTEAETLGTQVDTTVVVDTTAVADTTVQE